MVTTNEDLSKSTARGSVYNAASSIISKFLAVIYSILLARLLLPEAYGIYGLVLSVAILSLTFTDLGVGGTLVRYLSEAIGKNDKKKARAYVSYLFKLKGILILLAALVLISLSKFLSVSVFEKPIIFYPLLFSVMYVVATSIRALFFGILLSFRDFRGHSASTVFYELSKLLLSIPVLLLLSGINAVLGVFLVLALSIVLSTLLSTWFIRKKKYNFFSGEKSLLDKHQIKRYILYSGFIGISFSLFGQIDTLFLGRFVEVAYIGFYRVALSLATSVASLFYFGAIFFPTFSQIEGERLARGFKKSMKYLTLFTFPSFAGIIILSNYLVFALYGSEYLSATLPLIFLSPLILIEPLIAAYTSVLQAKDKLKSLSKVLLVSIGLNIILNLFLIHYLITFSPLLALVGVAIATLVSRVFYFVYLALKVYKEVNIGFPWEVLFKPFFSALLMMGVLILFVRLFDMNWLIGIFTVMVGALSYMLFMLIFGGIGQEELSLLKKIFNR